MHITFDTKKMSQLVNLARSLSEKRSSLNILSHLLIDASTGTGVTTIKATDLETSLTLDCPATIAEPGALTVDSQKLYALTANASDTEATLKTVKDRVELRCGKSKFVLPSFSAAEFPAIDQADTTQVALTLPAEDLRAALNATLYCTDQSPHSARHGVYLCHHDGSRIFLVSSDGHRLSEYVLLANQETPTWTPRILPYDGLQHARKLLEKATGEVTLQSGDATATLSTPGSVLGMRLVEGVFPDYRQAIPSSRAPACTVRREELLMALRRLLSIVPTDIAHRTGIKFAIAEAVITLTLGSVDTGEGLEEVACVHAAPRDPLIVGFSGHYLTDYLTSASSETITMEIADDKQPAFFRDERPAFHLLMPMRLF